MLPFFGKDRPTDRVLVLSGGTAELWPVTDDKGEIISTSRHNWPKADLACYHVPEGGRLYVVLAELPALVEAERIHALQEDAALKAIFAPSAAEAGGPNWLLYGLTALSIVGLIFKH